MRLVQRPLAALLLVAAATAQTVTVQQHIASRLTVDALKADVAFLASDALEGRGTPSRGQEVAAEFIAAQFRRAGLEPAGDDGYFQTASYADVQPNSEGLQLTLQSAGNPIPADKEQIFLTEGAALDLANTPAVKLMLADTAALNALTPEQMRDKVLILEPPGARGGVTPAALAARVKPALIIILGARPQGPGAPRVREMPLQSQVPILYVSDPATRTAMADMKEAVVSAHIAAPNVTPVKLRNVIGVLRGSDPQLKDTYVLVTAHYDHLGLRRTGDGDRIFNGANDNASGTSSLLEIAGTLASLPTRPRRSIVFMTVFAEELGLVGSRYYGRHPIFPLAKTVGDINLEMLGRPDDPAGSRVGMLNATGYDYSTLVPMLEKAGGNFGIRMIKDEMGSDAFFRRSDNQAFADAGIPAHTLSVGYETPDYHEVTDEWPKLNYENMANVARTVALAILGVADSADAPKWNAENPKTAPFIKAYETLMQQSGTKLP